VNCLTLDNQEVVRWRHHFTSSPYH